MQSFVYNSPQFQRYLDESPHLAGEVRFIRSIAKPGMIALDVGANRGVTTVTLAKAVREDGRVWAFELVPKHFATLQQNLRRNRVANVEAHQLAVTEGVGEIEFYKHGEGSGITPVEAAPRLVVAATSIDSFLGDRRVGKVDLFNADCEGSELLMLHGAERTLRAYCPQIFCGVHRSYLRELGQSIADLVGYLRQSNFEVKPVSVEHPDSKVDFDESSHIYATTQC